MANTVLNEMNEAVILNVGGVKFETFRSTLQKLPTSPLANESFLQRHYREERGDYFFDKDPDAFKAVLNFLRTGVLQLPSDAGLATRSELKFWGVHTSLIDCCLWKDGDWKSAYRILLRFERDRRGGLEADDQSAMQTSWQRFRSKTWSILHVPSSSCLAKLYLAVSMIFVLSPIVCMVVDSACRPEFDLHGFAGDDAPPNLLKCNDQDGLRLLKITRVISIACRVFFLLEYTIKLIVAPRKCEHVKSPLAVIDFLAVFPAVIVDIVSEFAAPSLRILRIFIGLFQILRLFRVFRFLSRMTSLWIVAYTIRATFVYFVIVTILMAIEILAFSYVIYCFEFETFHQQMNILQWWWWSLVTLTTVGYGDIIPITFPGKTVASLTALSAIVLIGLTVAALVNNFRVSHKQVHFALALGKLEEKTQKCVASNPAANGQHVVGNDNLQEPLMPSQF